MYGCADLGQDFRINRLYTAFAEEIESDYFFVGESHDFWELVIIAEGAVGVTAGREAVVMHAGQAVLHPPMEFHRIWYPGEPGRIVVISFGAQGLSCKAGGRFFVPEISAPQQILQGIQDSFRQEGISVIGMRDALRGQIAIKKLELFILENLDRPNGERPAPRSRSAENYTRLVQFLESNIHRSFSVDEIARQCSMSSINAKQTFSRYAGMGIMSYFNRRKVEAAIPMLQGGTSVQETAAALGFSSQNYFSTVFKRITGKTPTAYK